MCRGQSGRGRSGFLPSLDGCGRSYHGLLRTGHETSLYMLRLRVNALHNWISSQLMPVTWHGVLRRLSGGTHPSLSGSLAIDSLKPAGTASQKIDLGI
jgi:hypothetical protein